MMPRTRAWMSGTSASGRSVEGTMRGRHGRGRGRSGGRRPGLGQRRRNDGGPVEVGHLDVGGAERLGHVGVAAGAAGRPCAAA